MTTYPGEYVANLYYYHPKRGELCCNSHWFQEGELDKAKAFLAKTAAAATSALGVLIARESGNKIQRFGSFENKVPVVCTVEDCDAPD